MTLEWFRTWDEPTTLARLGPRDYKIENQCIDRLLQFTLPSAFYSTSGLSMRNTTVTSNSWRFYRQAVAVLSAVFKPHVEGEDWDNRENMSRLTLEAVTIYQRCLRNKESARGFELSSERWLLRYSWWRCAIFRVHRQTTMALSNGEWVSTFLISQQHHSSLW